MHCGLDNDLASRETFDVGDEEKLFERYNESIHSEFQSDGSQHDEQDDQQQE